MLRMSVFLGLLQIVFPFRLQPRMVVNDVSVVLLAGGVGSRMKADRPKQFLTLAGKPVLEHSIELFMGIEGVSQIVLVLDKGYRDQFSQYEKDERLVFADPGKERQDSVSNGLGKVPEGASLVAVQIGRAHV